MHDPNRAGCPIFGAVSSRLRWDTLYLQAFYSLFRPIAEHLRIAGRS